MGRVDMRRRRDAEDPLADVPVHLRAFDRGWFEVAAQGPDGYFEALMAVDEWLDARRRWKDEHGYRGDVLEWIRANLAARRDVWRASEVWRPRSERWMTRAALADPRQRGDRHGQ